MDEYGAEGRARKELRDLLEQHGYELDAYILADKVGKDAELTRTVTVRASRVVE